MSTTMFCTQNEKHFLTSEINGEVVADRDAAALEKYGTSWQQWNVVHVDQSVVALQSAHGRYLSALDEKECRARGVPPDSVQATAEYIDIWEQWTAVRNAGGVSFQSHWGKWLSPQNVNPDPYAGGNGVLANGPEPAGWEILYPSDWNVFHGILPLPGGGTGPNPGPNPIPPPTGGLPRPRMEDNRRWLGTSNGRLDLRSKSAFTLLGRIMAGETGYVRDYLGWMRNERFTEARVFICNTIGGYYSGPDQSNFWESCDTLVNLCAEQGIYLRACLIAATEPFGGVWLGHGVDIWEGDVKARGEAFCLEFASRYRDSTHVIYELFNEPCNIGLRHSEDEVIDLGHRVKGAAPQTVLMGGHYDNSRMCAQPFDIVTIHFARYMNVKGSEWIKRSSEYPPCQKKNQPVPMGALSGEPANAGQYRKDGRNDDVYRDPSVSFAAGAMSRAHQYYACFHSDDGLYTERPEDITIQHIRAWHDALDAFPMRTGNPWTGHHGHAAGDYWKDVWPPTDDTDEVEQHIRDRKGPWRAYGTDEYTAMFMEPMGWDFHSAEEAPQEKVAMSTMGEFQASVYRRV